MRKFLSLFAVLVLISAWASAQSKVVTGRLLDQQGQPTPFATIRIKGSKVGTSADAEGLFMIKAQPGTILVITGTGLTEKEVTVGDLTNLNITVTRKEASMTEVIVTALGITKQSKSLGYATAKITGQDASQAKPINVVNGLTGKVSGLQINTVNNGLFAPTRITLRGNRSLTGNNQPLIVVDGSIYYSDISTLNPDDINDYNILKGSSASAVYGSDASNGVIVITTKHGSRLKSSLTFSSTIQVEKVSYMPDLQYRFGSNGGEKFVDDFNDLSTYIPYENQSYGPEYNGKLVPLGRPVSDGSLLMVPYSAVRNQKKDFFNTGITSQQNLSFQSGDENGSMYLSMQDIVSKAIMPKDEGRRDIFRLGGTKKYGIFSTIYALAYTYKTTNTTSTYDAYENMIESPTLVPLSTLKDWQHNKFADPNGYYNDYYPNPYQTIDEYRNYNTENHAIGNVQLNLKPWKWLSLSYRANIDYTNNRYEYKGLEIKYSNYALTDDRVVYSNPSGTGVDTTHESAKYQAVSDNPHPASYGTANSNNLLFGSDLIASFNTDISRDFHLDATLGMSYLDNSINYTPIATTNLNFPPFNTSNFSSTANLNGQSYFHARKVGYFGEAQVGFRGLAYVHGSYRTDIDSRLSKDNRFIPYYDIDGSVIVSELFPGLKNSKVLNYIKLRYAHSLTGNVSALAFGSQYIAYGAYATVPTFSAGSGFPYAASGTSGYGISGTIANPNIKPEKITEDEIGGEFGFLNDRLTFGASVYKSLTTDGIVYAQVSRSSGAQQALINAAKSQNKGVELDLHATPIKTKDWSWTVGVNWTHNESKVLAITTGVNSLALSGSNTNSFAVVGHAYPTIQTYDWARDSASGKVIVDAVTGLPTRSPNLSIMGQANPKDILGLTTMVRWRNFSFSATADYRAGHKIYNFIANIIDHSGVGSTTAVSGRQRFVFPNSVYYDAGAKSYVDNTNITVNDGNFNFWPTLYRSVGANYITSAAAWKLREVVITYTFPQRILAPTKVIKNAAIAISGRNLIMIRPSTNKWTDPEFSEDNGNDVGRNSQGQAPPTRIFSATLSLTF